MGSANIAPIAVASLFLLTFSSFVSSYSFASSIGDRYILVGGESGTWFTPNQSPLFYEMSLKNTSEISNLTSSLDEPSGTVWTGNWNGSQWLVSGYGAINGTKDYDGPQIYLYDKGMSPINYDVSKINSEMKSWSGGDIFSTSWGGDDNWLVSGLGSGDICGGNHMALGLFNGSNFIDLSSSLSCEDYILYASAWNGQYWLIGGGYFIYSQGEVLYSYTPSNNTLNDLSSSIRSSLGSNFKPITSIAWNGKYWLIGGMGFLAKFDSGKFSDLTSEVNQATNDTLEYPNSVNSIKWDNANKSWFFGGGLPISITPSTYDIGSEQSWIVSYQPKSNPEFKDLTSLVIPKEYLNTSNSAILSLSIAEGNVVVGGYSTPLRGNQGMLLLYDTTMESTLDLSSSISSFGYVDWVGTHT
jgi:hypothetical protein